MNESFSNMDTISPIYRNILLQIIKKTIGGINYDRAELIKLHIIASKLHTAFLYRTNEIETIIEIYVLLDTSFLIYWKDKVRFDMGLSNILIIFLRNKKKSYYKHFLIVIFAVCYGELHYFIIFLIGAIIH